MMTDESMEGHSPDRPVSRLWPAAVGVGVLIGGVAAVFFGMVWFRYTVGNCGVVRFYEQLYGILVIGGWLGGTGVGLLMFLFAVRKRSQAFSVAGSLLVILASLAMLAICLNTVHHLRSADDSRRSTKELLVWLDGSDLDARIRAAHALGECHAPEALVPLCEILDDGSEDINLRHNAATAIGRICAAGQSVNVDRAMASLSKALEGRDPYLPITVAEAMSDIGDIRALVPLSAFLNDNTRPVYARCDVARAMGQIGGEKARGLLEQALRGVKDEDLTRAIRRAIESGKP